MLRAFHIRPWQVFLLVFAMLLVLYWPARDAGWVGDTLGWLDAVRHRSFGDFINRKGFGVQSLYQTTQLATWSFHQLFGADRLAWHLLHIVLQALNAALLFTFFRRLLSDFRLDRATPAALSAVLLFSVSPALSEVIVWEAAYHYLQGLFFIVLQLLLLQRFLHTGRSLPACTGAIVFAIASFSLELFYLSPVFSFLLLLLYRFGLPRIAPARISRASRAMLLPQLVLLALHLLLLLLNYGNTSGRLGTGLLEQPLSYFAIKPPDYLLHLAGGRFLPQDLRSAWHQLFCTYAGAGIFYALLAGTLGCIFFRFRRMSGAGQLLSWAWCATLSGMAIVTPMWFPERLLVMGDRYLYIMLPFVSLLFCVGIARSPAAVLRRAAFPVLLLVSAAGTRYLAGLWQASERLTATMQRRFPHIRGDENALLLNPPANYYGIPMTGAGPEGEFVLMRRLLYPELTRGRVAEAFAAEYRADGAAVDVRHAGPDAFMIRLHDTSRRWWFAADYASPVSFQGFSLRPISASAYILRFKPETRRPVLVVIWNGNDYELFRSTDFLRHQP